MGQRQVFSILRKNKKKMTSRMVWEEIYTSERNSIVKSLNRLYRFGFIKRKWDKGKYQYWVE